MTETRQTVRELLDTLPQQGVVTWIGLRIGRGKAMHEATSVEAVPGKGLVGDRYAGSRSRKREVTLIQAEHLPVIAACSAHEAVSPQLLRRNLVVAGINLLALRDRLFHVGDVTLEATGLCHPCSRMEAVLGPGGYNAMRGHGGLTAKVVTGGRLNVGDSVWVEPGRSSEG